MLNDIEIIKFSDILDKEYIEVIKPLLENAHKTIDSVLSCVRDKSWKEMARRNKSDGCFKFGYLDELEPIFSDLRYTGLSIRNYELEGHNTPNSLQGFCGYVDEGCPLVIILNHLHHDNNVGKVAELTRIKKHFNSIKNSYDELFVKNDGAKFKSFVDKVKVVYENVVNCDKESDREFYALFNAEPPRKSIRITVTIEEV